METARRALVNAIDRVKAEQQRRGKSPSREVQLAITNAQQALHWLDAADREA